MADRIKAINTALEQAFITGWGATTAIDWPTRPLTVDTQTTAWVRFTNLNDERRRDTVGSGGDTGQDLFGTVIVQVFTRRTAPPHKTPTQLGHVDTISNLFNETYFSVSTGGQVRCDKPNPRTVGPTPDGVWFQENILIPWHHHIG